MAITFDEVAQTVINLVRNKEFLESRIQQLEKELVEANASIKNVREPDKPSTNSGNKESK